MVTITAFNVSMKQEEWTGRRRAKVDSVRLAYHFPILTLLTNPVLTMTALTGQPDLLAYIVSGRSLCPVLYHSCFPLCLGFRLEPRLTSLDRF